MEQVVTTKEQSVRRGNAPRIIIAGGGTGGHIFPALAIANALINIETDAKILFVGARGKMEMDKVPEAGYKIEGLTIAGFDRSSMLKNISLPFKMIKSFFEVNSIFKAFKPDAAVGVGGYSSFPVLKSAQLKGIPTFIHESNSLPGRSNIMLGKKATRVFVAYPGMEKYFSRDRLSVSGNPVRKSLTQAVKKEDALNFFGLKSGKKTVLVIGGSLGAASINEAIEKNIAVFRKNDMQLIWQTGKLFSERAAAIEEDAAFLWTNAFINNMEYAYSAADIVVSRSGAMTLTELSVVGKPAILIPYPYSAEDHQTVNAKTLVDAGAAEMIKDENVREELMKKILELTSDAKLTAKMSEAMRSLAVSNADELIAAEILKNIKHY